MKRMQPLPGCTAEQIDACRRAKRDCRRCPPLPRTGIADWLAAERRKLRAAGLLEPEVNRVKA
jgi:hypothetical protein